MIVTGGEGRRDPARSDDEKQESCSPVSLFALEPRPANWHSERVHRVGAQERIWMNMMIKIRPKKS